MEPKELYEFLLEGYSPSNSIWVYFEIGQPRRFWHNSVSVYFQDEAGYYDSFGLCEKENIYKYVSRIVRVEKKFGEERYPIWTIDDGIIEDFTHFVKIRGKYYTINQIECIFDKIEEIKKDLQYITRA
jgi:hypothetical protein